ELDPHDVEVPGAGQPRDALVVRQAQLEVELACGRPDHRPRTGGIVADPEQCPLGVRHDSPLLHHADGLAAAVATPAATTAVGRGVDAWPDRTLPPAPTGTRAGGVPPQTAGR